MERSIIQVRLITHLTKKVHPREQLGGRERCSALDAALDQAHNARKDKQVTSVSMKDVTAPFDSDTVDLRS
jgi:hypothetical protein